MRLAIRSILLVVLPVMYAGTLCAQEPAFRRFTMKEGLPGAVVYHCVQDKQRFIWFATNQGVSRFDGSSFRNFSKEDGLPDNEITKLFVDRHGAVWFISLSGVPAVYWDGKIKTLDCRGVNTIAEDLIADSIHLQAGYVQDNVPYVGTYITKNDPGNWQFSASFKKADPYQEMFNRMNLRAASDGVNFYFTQLDREQSQLRIKTRQVTRDCFFNTIDNKAFLTAYTAVSFFSVVKNSPAIVFHNSNTLFYADLRGIQACLSLTDLGLNIDRDNDVNALLCENDSTLWICTRNKGLIRIDHFRRANRRVRYYFSKSFCTSLVKDAEGGLWVTTASEGVFYLPNLDFYTLDTGHELGESDAKCIKVIGHYRLAAGFVDGRIELINPLTITTVPLSAWAERNQYNRVLDIKKLGRDLFVTTDAGVFRLRPDQSFRRAWKLSGTKESLIVSDSVLLMAGAAGVIRYRWGAPVITDIFRGRASSITGDGDQYYWSTQQGLYRSEAGLVSKVGEKDPALSGIVNYVTLGPYNTLWAATQHGVVVYRNERSHVINTRDGLLSNGCRHVYVEGQIAWVSTDKGVAKVTYRWVRDSLIYSVLAITENDGLASNDVNQVAIAGDQVWVAAVRGITYFSKAYGGTNFVPPTIVLDRIWVDNLIMPVTDTLTVDQRDNLRVEVAGIAYHHANNVYYQYRLRVADEAWYPLVNNKIAYSSLPYGSYALEIAAFNRHTDVVVATRRLFIVHEPPFWKQGWFLLLSYFASVGLAGLLIFLYYRRRQVQKDSINQVNKKLHDLEIMALRAQMNPHFIFNCLNSIQHYILTADVENANLYLHRFSMLIRKTLQMSSSALIPLEEEISMLELYLELEQMRLDERMAFEIMVDDAVNKHEVFIPSLVIQPFVENAVKHGIGPLRNRKGKLSVRFSMQDNCLECLVIDNGIGLNVAKKFKAKANYPHVSMGHSVTAGRIELINSIQKNKIILQVTDRSELSVAAEGTLVRIIFPLSNG